MQKYTINKKDNKLSFEKQLFDSQTNQIISSKRVFCPLYKVKVKERTYYVLYDDEMNVINDFYDYVNNHSFSSLNTKMRCVIALRYLYIFLELNSYSVYDLSEKIINELKDFLIGMSMHQETDRLLRTPETVNSYLSVYRSFCRYKKINAPALFSKQHSCNNRFTYEQVKRTNLPYNSNIKINKSNFEVPKYITIDEFEKIKEFLIKIKDKQSLIIIKLMFVYGLRLGEVLGLTAEDVSEIKNNDGLTPVIYLRNRVSDKRYQFCKNIYHPNNKQEYTSKFYQKTWVIIPLIEYEFYDEIIDFIGENQSFYSKHKKDGFEQAVADSIFDSGIKNHYIFLNRYGKPLSDQTWNNTLKKIFNTLNIPVDKGVKENNLSHRFRHGFAMYHARFSQKPANAYELMTLMRHKAIQSTEKYYNPTFEEQIKTKKKFITNLYKNEIPELDNCENKNK